MEKPAFSVPAKKMAMWLFIIADSATFAGCLVAYGFLRNATPNWPRPFPSITNVAIMTFILVTSSLTMLFGIDAAKMGDKAKALRWTLITAGLGTVFAILHIREWLELIDKGMTLFKNPWGTPLFGSAFFSITGLHLLHVTGGVIALIAVGIRYKRRTLQRRRSGNHGPLLAFRGLGMDVRCTTRLSSQPHTLRKVLEYTNGYG